MFLYSNVYLIIMIIYKNLNFLVINFWSVIWLSQGQIWAIEEEAPSLNRF